MRVFSERLTALRRERDMSQYDLAKSLNKQRSTISGYESEDKEPPYSLLCSMASLFGVTTDYLLGRDDDRTRAGIEWSCDSAAFRRGYDALPPELKSTVTSTLNSVYRLLSRAVLSQDGEELRLYDELLGVLQRERDTLRSIASRSSDLSGAFPELMEHQNTLKTSLVTAADSLLQSDITAAGRK